MFKILIKEKFIFKTNLFNFSRKSEKAALMFGLTDTDNLKKLDKNLQNEYLIKQTHKEQFKSREQLASRKDLLKQEITSNPEFFKAFPHLKEISNNEEEQTKLVNQLQNESKIKMKQESSNNKYNDMELKTEEQKENENFDTFVSAYSKSGPKKLLTQEEKDRIHEEIDIKMNELESTGLSREEILYNKPDGLPLRQDKFFQYLKNNRIAREMLIKPNEEFTVEIVLEKALKQDIGPDPSLGVDRKIYALPEELSRGYYNKVHNQAVNAPNYEDKLLKDDVYDYKTNYVDKMAFLSNINKSRPISYVNPPLGRAQLRKKYMIRTIKKSDINWRNLPLLVKFLNEGGKLLNKYQTRLPTSIHRRVAKTVKHARNLGLLPFNDMLKPNDKMPLTSMVNDFYQDVRQVVDPHTGKIQTVKDNLEKDKFSYSSHENIEEARRENDAAIDSHQLKNCLSLNLAELPFIPDQEQKLLLLAHNYLARKDSDNDDKYSNSELIEEENKAYYLLKDKLGKDLNINNLFETFIKEKSYRLNEVTGQKYLTEENKEGTNVRKEINRLRDEIDKIVERMELKNGNDKIEAKVQINTEPTLKSKKKYAFSHIKMNI